MKRFIQLEVGRDDQLCAGCKHADPIGGKYWRCIIFREWLETSVGRPVRCRSCVARQISPRKDMDTREQTTCSRSQI